MAETCLRLRACLAETPDVPHLHEEVYWLLRQSTRPGPGTHLDLSPIIADLLDVLFARDFVRHSDLAERAVEQLQRRHPIGLNVSSVTPEALELALGADALFLGLLRRVVNTDLQVERIVRKVRRVLLLETPWNSEVQPPLLSLLVAFTEQGFNNESILHEDEEERQALDALAR